MFNIKNFIEQYEMVFDKINEKYFNNELPKVVLTTNTDTTKGAYGWCTNKEVWKQDKGDTKYYEIVLTSENLNRSPEDIAGTVFHEMIHLYNAINDIVDTSGNGFYHNKKFKETAEKFDINVEKTTYGFSKTTLNEDHLKFIETLNLKKFDFYRAKAIKISKPNKGKKYQCPCCGASFWSTKDMHVTCDDCKEEFIIVN